MQLQSPAKRKRPALHHDQSIAASNATARRMLGNQGQYSWMQSNASPSSHQPMPVSAQRGQQRVARLDTSTHVSAPTSAHIFADASTDTSAQPVMPPSLASLDAPSAPLLPRSRAPPMPLSSPRPLPDTPIAVSASSPSRSASRQHQAPSGMFARGQFLPSPAPSEDQDKLPQQPAALSPQSPRINTTPRISVPFMPTSTPDMPPPVTPLSAALQAGAGGAVVSVAGQVKCRQEL